jgi:hypothetical protein
MKHYVLFACLLVGACATQQTDEPRGRFTIRGEFQKIAGCMFLELDRQLPAQIKLVNLEGLKTVRISQETMASGILGTAHYRFFEAVITPNAVQGQTDIEVRATPTIGSENLHFIKVRAAANACAERA